MYYHQKRLLTCAFIIVGLTVSNTSASIQPYFPTTAPSTNQRTVAPKNPHLWKPKTISVAVFKNGYGFFMRQGPTALHDGWCVAEQVPPATFGTLAIYSHNQDQIVDIVGSGPGEIIQFDDHDAPNTNAEKRSRLESLKNLKISLSYTRKDVKKSAAGNLISIGPEFVILENKNNSFAVPIAGISKIQILDLPVRAHVTDKNQTEPNNTILGMAYLRSGITWIPEYTVKILDDNTAELTLRGTLVNQAEDLIHCDVNFVVGVPHFLHTDYLAPIAVGQVIRTIGSAIAPVQIANQLTNQSAIASNNIMDPSGFGSSLMDRQPGSSAVDVNNVLGNLPQMGGSAATDFTVYTKKDLTVRRGEKAIVTLFVKK